MRIAIKAALGVIALAVVALVAIYALMRRSLPELTADATVAGISAPIEIVRDADAIPHIYAATKADAFFGLGYAHAQDRLWQMEFERRIGHGRLSEIFGAATIPQDRFLRTVGFGRAARAAWSTMPDWAKQQIDAYVAGVNAFIAAHHGSALPPEFSILRFEPEPWSGPDVLVWVKMMAWDLSANYTYELLRDDLVRAVGPERMADLMLPYPVHGLSIVSDGGASEDAETDGNHSASKRRAVPTATGSSASARSAVAQLTATLSTGNPTVRDLLLGGATTEAIGSNNWVVDGTLTASGKPMLANDPHLGTRVPSIWYLAHMVAGDFEAIGATLPGTPAIALGRNRRIAWGATNVGADVEDLYREHIDSTGRMAEFEGRMEPMLMVPETIVVKGAAPVRVDVRITRHGPLVSDAINANPPVRGPKPPPLEPLALRWTALAADDSTIPSFLRLNEARNWDEFTAALRDYVVPSQNFVYADVDGHIGYYAPGRIPLRASGDGSLPADGWTGAAEWTGWVPFESLPHLFDPPDHMIVTANHRPAPASYPYNLGLEWPEPYRAQRITDLLRAAGAGRAGGAGTAGPAGGVGETGSAALSGPRTTPRLTQTDFARIQADTVSLHAKAVVPLLLAHVHPESDTDRRAVELLRQWNFNTEGSSAPAAIFEAWFQQIAPALAGDELGTLATNGYRGRTSFVTRFLVHTLSGQDAAWCDDVSTPGRRETCEDAITGALHNALTELTSRLGSDMSRWRWEAVHHAVFPHQGLDSVGFLRPLLSRSVPNGGDWSTVNVGPVSADTPFDQRNVPSYRQIVDLSPANESVFLDAVGQSGHPLSAHYDDFLQDWHDVKHRAMRMERADVEKGALGHLTLRPQR